MILQEDYLERAIKYESIFRAILRNIKCHGDKIPLNPATSEEINTDYPIGDIFRIYSTGKRDGLFTILDFQVFDKKIATISFQNIDYQHKGGSGAEIRYRIISDNLVEYEECLMDWQIKL